MPAFYNRNLLGILSKFRGRTGFMTGFMKARQQEIERSQTAKPSRSVATRIAHNHLTCRDFSGPSGTPVPTKAFSSRFVIARMRSIRGNLRYT